MINKLSKCYPKLFIIEAITDDLVFDREPPDGFIEYKRTLANCSTNKIEKYATQMKWRITENTKNQSASYYIGVDDDGTIIGLSDEEIIESMSTIILITNSIQASISMVKLISIKTLIILKIIVKLKKIENSYLVDFVD